jgi:chitinase
MQENYHRNIKICPVCRSSETEFIAEIISFAKKYGFQGNFIILE